MCYAEMDNANLMATLECGVMTVVRKLMIQILTTS